MRWSFDQNSFSSSSVAKGVLGMLSKLSWQGHGDVLPMVVTAGSPVTRVRVRQLILSIGRTCIIVCEYSTDLSEGGGHADGSWLVCPCRRRR